MFLLKFTLLAKLFGRTICFNNQEVEYEQNLDSLKTILQQNIKLLGKCRRTFKSGNKKNCRGAHLEFRFNGLDKVQRCHNIETSRFFYVADQLIVF